MSKVISPDKWSVEEKFAFVLETATLSEVEISEYCRTKGLYPELMWLHYYLYMIEDIYSRKIVGWEVHTNETGEQAAGLLERSVWLEKCRKQDLVLHSGNDAPMKSLTMQAKMYLITHKLQLI